VTTSLIAVDIDFKSQIVHIPLKDGSALIIVKNVLGKASFYRWNATLCCLEVVKPVGGQ
jgi:hypothetical protein